MLVVDASALVPAIADGTDIGRQRRQRLSRERLDAPDLILVESLSVIRRQTLAGMLDAAQGEQAVDDLLTLPIVIHPTAPLLRRAWELRSNVTPYDACYAALAEALNCPLLTGDARLARAPGLICEVEVVG
ncbi:type II toxin-antitoxin system VapC family toxin [Candidatus Poriferisocius sp.]|uniref:type II toxin-antitoxin system VapC family toxin n=1 Tax=Candidatus Poriferisocius sp. TaxID=3101276 RepID=UPI003B5A72A5